MDTNSLLTPHCGRPHNTRATGSGVKKPSPEAGRNHTARGFAGGDHWVRADTVRESKPLTSSILRRRGTHEPSRHTTASDRSAFHHSSPALRAIDLDDMRGRAPARRRRVAVRRLVLASSASRRRRVSAKCLSNCSCSAVFSAWGKSRNHASVLSSLVPKARHMARTAVPIRAALRPIRAITAFTSPPFFRDRLDQGRGRVGADQLGPDFLPVVTQVEAGNPVTRLALNTDTQLLTGLSLAVRNVPKKCERCAAPSGKSVALGSWEGFEELFELFHAARLSPFGVMPQHRLVNFTKWLLLV